MALSPQQLEMQVPHASSNPDPKAQPSQQDELKTLSFSGPIPGQSLTHEPGQMPWEQPPMYTTKEDAMNFLMDRVTEPEHASELFRLFKMGISVEEMTRMLIFTGFQQGSWTVDIGMLIYHPLMLGLIALANRAGLTDTPVVMHHRFGALEKKAMADMQMQNEADNTSEEEPEEEAPPSPNGFMERPQ